MGGRRPMDRAIGLVRGALYNLGPDKKTFWTAEVADQLNDFVGFRSNWKERGSGGIAVQRCQGILDWLGYRVVEARPNRNGFIYRWALDLTRDRAAEETLPLIVPTQENSDVPVEETEPQATLVNPPEPLQAEKPVEVKEEVPVERADDGGGVPAVPGVGVERQPEVAVQAEQPEVAEPQPTEPPAAMVETGVAVVGFEAAPEHRQPVSARIQAATSADMEAALQILDDVGSWAVSLDSLGKAGKRLESMIKALGLQGELRVWRR